MNNTEKKYYYIWYHNNAVAPERQREINGVIVTHDWEAFKDYKQSLKDMAFFPNKINVFDFDDEDISNFANSVPLDEESFKLIDWADCMDNIVVPDF